MDSIRISSGVKRIAINDDPERVIEFNPNDVAFAERFYGLVKDFEAKQEEFQARAESIDAQTSEVDEFGLPTNTGEKLAFVREVCTYMYEKIDYLFGAGASQKIFGEVLNLDMIGQFFEGIMPFIQAARSEKVTKYAPTSKGKRVMK